MLPVDKRQFHAFLSHSSHDKPVIVEKLNRWMNDVAGLRVWYDADALSGGTAFGSALPQAIGDCRSLIVLISKASVNSNWVNQEINYALVHQNQYQDFRIIPVMLDDTLPPGFLGNNTGLKIPDAEFTLDAAEGLLKAIFRFDPSMQAAVQHGRVRDVYVSRTWRDAESPFADAVCAAFIGAGFRLIGDAKDQRKDDTTRIETIMSSCGGMVAILPLRADEPTKTSPFMLDEIAKAAALKLPFVILTEPGVEIPDALAKAALHVVSSPAAQITDAAAHAAALLYADWQPPAQPQYVFYATDFDTAHEKRNGMIRRLIERTTAMQCIMGDAIEGTGTSSVQKLITERIRGAFLVVADVTGDNLNTMIEAGIARGANVETLLVSGDARHDPPFMFRDQQIFYYGDDLDMYGKINRLILPYRRRVIDAR